jgi:hypothetical protein
LIERTKRIQMRWQAAALVIKRESLHRREKTKVPATA